MEIEVSLKQWNHPVEQMEENLKILSRQEEELRAIRQNMIRDFQGEEWSSVRKMIGKAEETLQDQISHLWDMKIALEKIKRLYEDCENEMIAIGEGEKKWMPENLKVQDLKAWNLMPFKLKTEGE